MISEILNKPSNYTAGTVKFFLLLVCERDLNDLLNPGFSNHAGDTGVNAMLPVFSVQQRRSGKDLFGIVENGLDDLGQGDADAKLCAALSFDHFMAGVGGLRFNLWKIEASVPFGFILHPLKQ